MKLGNVLYRHFPVLVIAETSTHRPQSAPVPVFELSLEPSPSTARVSGGRVRATIFSNLHETRTLALLRIRE